MLLKSLILIILSRLFVSIVSFKSFSSLKTILPLLTNGNKNSSTAPASLRFSTNTTNEFSRVTGNLSLKD
ncbi:MAG: hypothetical protein ACLSWA_09780 [Thomasclavelia spiroformis]